jgi:hypothetical protein
MFGMLINVFMLVYNFCNIFIIFKDGKSRFMGKDVHQQVTKTHKLHYVKIRTNLALTTELIQHNLLDVKAADTCAVRHMICR